MVGVVGSSPIAPTKFIAKTPPGAGFFVFFLRRAAGLCPWCAMLFRRLTRLPRAVVKPALPLEQTLILPMRVWPTDLNFGGHMDNVRYMALMDLARSLWFTRTRLAKLTLARKLATPVAAAQVRYRRELFFADRFTLHTRLVYWDAKWFFLEQWFMRGEVMTTRALFKCAFVGRDGTLNPQPLFDLLCSQPPAPPVMPLAVDALLASEAMQRRG